MVNKIPNYVYSTLSLNGSKNDIKKFRAKFEAEGELKANKVIPYPRDLELLDMKSNGEKLTKEDEIELTLIALEGKYDMSKDGFNQGGYDWSVKNWGTKWGFCDCETEEVCDDFVNYSFSTAWSPITPVIIEMSKQFPKIEFNYFCDEEGGAFRFEEEYLNGISIDYEDRTYEIEIERAQEEEDYQIDRERDRKIDEEMEKSN